jgi:hypothetical protein
MLAIDPATGIVAISILFAVYQYLRRAADPARWADSRRAHHLQRVRENLLAANIAPEHPRDWRPQIVAFSEDLERRPRLLRLAGWLEGGSGLTTVVTLLEGKDLLLSKRKQEAEHQLQRDVREHNPAAFPLVLTSRNIELAVHALLQAHGIGPLRVNTVLLNWLDTHNDSGMGFREFLFGRQLKTLHRLGCNIGVLYAQAEAWQRLMDTPPDQSRIDVWWSDDATGRLMLLFAYLMTRSEAWKGAPLRLLVFAGDAPESDREATLNDILSDARIQAEIVFAGDRDAAAVAEMSSASDLVFLPFRFHGNLIRLAMDGPAETLLQQLPTTVLISAAEDIDLGAEPEEGAAAELAEARDRQKKKIQLAEAAEAQAVEAALAADAAEEILRKAMARPQARDDQDRIQALIEERDRTAAAAEKTRRKAAKARVKADQAQEALEDGAPSVETSHDDVLPKNGSTSTKDTR